MSHKMSISIPEITITKKQFFGEDVELQVYDNKLYITRRVNGVVEGGTIVLDPLPPEATLGTYGSVTATSAVTGEYTLAVNSEDYTEAEMGDLALQLQAELAAQFPGTTINVTVVAGSLKFQYTIVPDDIQSWDHTAAVATLGTERKNMLKRAATAAGKTDLATSIENDTVIPTSSVTPTLAAQVLPGLVKSVSYDSGTLSVVTLGLFKRIEYSLDEGLTFIGLTPGAGSTHTVTLAESPINVRVQLFNAGGGRIARALATIAAQAFSFALI